MRWFISISIFFIIFFSIMLGYVQWNPKIDYMNEQILHNSFFDGFGQVMYIIFVDFWYFGFPVLFLIILYLLLYIPQIREKRNQILKEKRQEKNDTELKNFLIAKGQISKEKETLNIKRKKL